MKYILESLSLSILWLISYIYKKRLLLRCIHHFKSDFINNMDHMRISGNEPSSVILSQTMAIQKLKAIAQKCQNMLRPKGMV